MELIKDKGKVRNCPANRYRMGYWRSLWAFHSYKDEADSGKEIAIEIFKAVRGILEVCLYLILLPVIPFARCYYEHRQAIKDVEGQYDREW